MAITIDGLVTGIDTTKIIDGLLSIERQRIELLKNRQDKVVQQQTAFKSIEARLLSLQSRASRLGRPQSTVFDLKKVTSSNPELVAAAGSSNATPGVYQLRVNSLARAHQIATQGFDDPGSTITQGTFQIRVGSGATSTITVDSTNNTLQGLAAAINNATAGVTATIINDGSNSLTQPYRLVLSSNKTGLDGAITITNNLAADSGGARRPVLDASYVAAAVTDAAYTGSSTPSSNAGAGSFSGSANTTYSFTIITGGTVGTDDGIQISFVDSSGQNSGTITVNSSDADVFKSVAEGLQVKFSTGTLVTGQQFTIDAFVPTVQEATNATVTLGSGSGALTVESATNQVEGLIPGVTLDLQGADNSQEVRLTIAADTDNARQAILDFVKSYNDLMDFIDQQLQFEPETNQAGVLLGNRSATSIQDVVRRSVTDLVGGVNAQMNRLSALGITTNSQGRLDVDQARLDDALAGRLSGVSLDDVRRLFNLAGQSTQGGVQFVTGTIKTKASTTPYQVDLSQVAEQATITATNALAASTVIDGTNDQLTITVDGKVSSTIGLAHGTYTRLALAQELEAEINADVALGARSVSVSLNNDRLVITSDAYGLASEVTIGTGIALTTLGFAGTETDKGQDVVGKFVVNGVDEAAVGTGQFLVGQSSNPNTAGLQVRVTLNGSQIQAGPEASLTITRGVASKIDVMLSQLLDPVTGQLKTINDGFQETVDDLQNAQDRQNQLIDARRQSLLAQFVALEQAVSQLRSTGDFLTAQLATLNTLRQR